MTPGWQRYVDYPRLEGILKATKESIENKDSKEALVDLGKAFVELEGVEIFEGTNLSIINEMLEAENFDYVFSFWDIWKLHHKLQPLRDRWIAHIPIDTEWICDMLKETCLGTDMPGIKDPRGPGICVAMSQHGVRELNSIGIPPYYLPLGIDTKLFRPKPEGRKAFRDDFGFDDKTFLIGSVSLNYGDDRKGFIPLLRAFKVFHERHPEARLYIHSHAEGKYPGTINYLKVVQKLGIGEWVYWPHQSSNDIGRIDGEWLTDVYSGMDVFCTPNRGEGFGLCSIESAACGVPVIATNSTTGPEFHRAGVIEYLIEVCDSDMRWLPNGVWRHEVGEAPILETLEKAFEAWKGDDYDKLKEKARKNAQKYSWSKVWKTWWAPFWQEMEEKLEMEKKQKKD